MKSTARARCGVGARPMKMSTLPAWMSVTPLPQVDFDRLHAGAEGGGEVGGAVDQEADQAPSGLEHMLAATASYCLVVLGDNSI